MSDPSFLLPAKVEEPKSKAKKVSKVNNEANTEKVSNINTSSKDLKSYCKNRVKNDLDTITKKIDKIKLSIDSHDEILKTKINLLKDLEIKKNELTELKNQI